MIHRTWALAPLAAVVLTGAAPAATVQNQQNIHAAADRVRSHVEFLANDLLEGRAAGTRGHEVAAIYVASQFRSLGLTPAGDGSWYQRVPFRRASHDGTPTVTLTAGGKTTPLAWGTEVGIRPSLTQRERNVRSGLVFAGYGIADRALGIDDFRGLDVRGKTVVVFSGTPDGMDSEVAAHVGSQKQQMAAAAGAIGIIEISRQPSGEGRLGQFARGTAVDWVDTAGNAGNTPKGLQFRMAVSDPTAAGLFQGARATLAQVRAQASTKGNRPAGFPLMTSLAFQARAKWTDFTSPAVLGILPGSDPTLKSQYVLLMGHLDHLGIKPDAKPGEDAIYNGALDNAAGVATMLEAAHEFVDSAKRPKRSVLFIAHTGEELGLLGADYWAAHPTVPIGQVAAAVDLDMPVPLYQFSDVVAFGANHSTVARTVGAAAKTMGMTTSPDPMPEQSIFVRSDHYPLARRGVPAILLFTGYGSGGKPVWDKFFAERYHSVRDDLSQPILWDAAARYAQLNYRIARQLADDPQRPQWYRGSYFGETFAPTQAKAAR